MAMEQVIVELQHARSPAAPAKVDAGAGSPPALLPPGERRALGKNWEAERGRPRDGELRFIYFPPLSDGRMLGERRSSSEIWSPKMLNKWAGVSPKWERAAIGCCRPAVPMGA